MRNLIFCILTLLTGNPILFAQQNEKDISEKINNLMLDSRFKEVIDLIDSQGLPEAESIILQNKKAEAFTRLGRLSEAETTLDEILVQLDRQPDDFQWALTNTNVGFLQLSQGRNDLAQESLQNAIAAFTRSDNARSLELAQALANLGLVYMSTGKYAQAEEQLHMALSLRLSKMADTHELIAATYNDLGLVYSQTDKNKGLDYFEKALVIYSQLHGKEHAKIAIASINTGIIYRDLELYGDAVNNFETSLKIWNKVYPEPHPAKAIALFNLGQTYLRMKDAKAAMAYYEQSYKIYEQSYGPKHPEVAYVLNAIGNLQVAQGDFDKALDTYQKAMQANVPDFNDPDVKKNPSLGNYYHGTRLLHSLLFKAQAFEARYLKKSLRFSDLSEALISLSKCDTLIDHLRQQSTNESDKLQLGIIANEVYGDGVRIAHEAGINAISKAPFFRQAYYFAEKSKSAVLLESISNAHAKSFAGIPEDLLEQEKQLKSQMTLTARQLSQKQSPDEEHNLRQTAFELSQKYESFEKNLANQFPEYFNLKFNAASPSIEQLQHLLPENTAVLSYFTDEKNNHLYIFLVRKNTYRILHHTLPDDFNKFITGLRNGIYFSELKTFKRSAYELGRILIPRLPSQVKEVVILPSGKLGVIPFETLLTSKAERNNDFKTLPYLVNDFAVRYEFSAGLIFQKSTRPKNEHSPSIFLCAPVTFPQNNRLGELPGTETEVREIAKLFSGKNLQNATFIRTKADESLVKTGGLKNYNLLHFATHGIVDEVNPELSRIYLQSQSEEEDGNLFAGEIYNLELNANLVTLSACQTGLGKIFKGEGVIGLSRALVYAGAKNIIVSFWSVADESTSLFMMDFYQKLLSNPQPYYSRDLRLAKLSLLKNEKYAAPFYWAPFVLIGF
jgi:CHAT domain-containing protein/Tfp pilus assembly protein PilF